MVIRLVFLLLLLWIVWFMIRNFLNKQARHNQTVRKVTAGKIVKCQYCDLHLPQQEALQHDADWFCTRDHMQAFLGKHTKS
jgi:uncharacterized protein